MADMTKDITSSHLEYSDDGNTTKRQVFDLAFNIRNLPRDEREQLEKKLVGKVDIRLLIMIVVMYILNYLDRNNIAAAKLAGLEKDLHLVGDQYQLSVSILFVGYLLMQVPSNMVLNKLGKPSLYLPGCMLVWGVISCATAATHSFTGLLLCRFFLGFVEAAYFPGCLYLLSAWYTRKELVKRTALLYSGSLLSGAFSGLISAGITSGLNGARGIDAWRWLFIIEGSITVFAAFVAFFIIPDLPRTTPWLTEEEKALAAWRLEADIGEDDWVDQQHQSMLHGAKLAFFDIKAWLLLGTIYGCTASGAVTTFFPSVMAGLGKNNIQTLLLTTPPYLIGTILVLINAWHADLTGERYLHMVLPPILAIVAFILAMAGTSFAARYVAMCIMLPGIYSGYVVALGYISNILPRPATKRAAALALINCLSNVCQIYTPYLYPNSASPRYITAFSVNIAMSSMTIIFATILRIYLGRLNKGLDREEGTGMGPSSGQRRENEEQGLPGQAVSQGFRFLL
ncbi:MFS general substrate transporter [Aspergillus homomorphus CBS 101889]|uniref:MFS general substrate transporter n=1 Tax=Aspergillus homomorphus (strain CBS 101889) TaxID=1450537 RepID=A0A395HH32_ASPHC|nr:MFS general substrate transporter [Aspergillus homomorphus CBS 101889]RAL06956.1 MFS general substrate transporter [Aspergillus homomorphus CBS 101889]